MAPSRGTRPGFTIALDSAAGKWFAARCGVGGIVDPVISGPGFVLRYREDEATWQQVRPGTVRRIWPYLRRYRGKMVLLLGITAVESAVLVVSTLILRL